SPSLMPGQGEVDWTADPNTLATQLNAYFTKRGVAPSETPYWVQQASALVARGKELNDPTYADKRLAAADIFGGGGGTGNSALAGTALARMGIATPSLPMNFADGPATVPTPASTLRTLVRTPA